MASTNVQVRNNRKDGNPVARGGFIFPGNGNWHTVSVPDRKLIEIRACRDLDARVGDAIVEEDEYVPETPTNSGNVESGTKVDPQPTVEASPENLDPNSDDEETREASDGSPENVSGVAESEDLDGADEDADFESYDDWGVNELREECRNRELPVSGTKAELVARLDESDLEDEDE